MSVDDIPSMPSTSGTTFSLPDRQMFETKIWRVSNHLQEVQDKLRNYWSEARREEFSQHKQAVTDLKKKHAIASDENNKYTHALKELEDQLQQKCRDIQELEDNDLIFKNLDQAQKKLASVEEKYKRQKFSSMREEQMQVNEVNRIKRNIAKLAKYIPLVEQRKSIEAQIKEDRQKIRDLRSKIRQYRDNIQDHRSKIKDMQQPFQRLREILSDLRVEKRNLIEQYNDERKSYNRPHKPLSQPAPLPSAAFHDQFGDPLDLFHVQKTNCQRLIRYLERLIRSSALDGQIGGTDQQNPNFELHYHANESSESSADELPESFQQLGVIRPTQRNSLKNRDVKRMAKKQGLPLSHGIDYIKLFNDLDILPPKFLAEVPKALQDVKEALDFFEKQTAIPSNDDFLSYNSPIPSLFSAGGSESCFESPFLSPRSLSSCSLARDANNGTPNSAESPSSSNNNK
ncbi:hypothetical protein Ddc_05377 [Ditylenchus destructor]|nr:hypothetical protein Ddc_05377 [Ditylenchus destructor]